MSADIAQRNAIRGEGLNEGPDTSVSVRGPVRAPERRPLRTGLIVAALTAATAAVTLATLTDRSIWIDEALTESVATAPTDRFLDDLSYNGGNMSLYLIFMRLWLVAGSSDLWLRLPSALFASACLPAFFVVARRFVSTETALGGTVVLLASAPLAYHAQEARSYSLSVLLAILAWLALFRLAEKPSLTARSWYIAAAVALVYSHIIGLLYVAAQLTWLLGVRRRDTWLAGGAIIALSTPQLLLAFGPNAHGPSWIPTTTPAALLGSVRFLAGVSNNITGLLVATIWIIGGAVCWRRRDHLFLAPVAWVVVPLVGLLTVSIPSPMFQARYLVMVVPGAVLLICIACDARRRAGAVVVAVLLGLMIPSLYTTVTRSAPDWREATQLVIDHGNADDSVLFIRSRHLVEHYWSQNGRPQEVPASLSSPRQWGDVRRTYVFDLQAAQNVLNRSAGVWVVDRTRHFELAPAEQQMLSEIQARWSVTESWSLDDGAIRVTYYGTES